MRLENGIFCPLIKKDCAGLKCAWFTKVVGYDSNTGKEVDEYQCAVAWLPMLLIENSGQQRQTGAAVESFRNEMVKSNETSQKVLLASLGFQNQQEHVLEIEPPKVKTVKTKTVRSK
jgi:hypothetical protein